MKIKEFLKKRWRNAAMIALLVCLIGSMAVPAMAQVVIVRPPLVVDDIPVDGAITDPVSSNWAYDHQTATNAPTGFPNRTDSTLSFVSGTRTFSIAPSNGSFIYYIVGVQYTVSSLDDIVIADTSGAHVIYYDGNTLSVSVNPSDATMEDLIENKALVGIIYWNATDNATYLLADERHGCQMSGRTHLWLHEVTGAAYHSGLTLSGYTEDTDSDAALTFELTDGQYDDEDLQHIIVDGNPATQYSQQLNGGDAEIPIVYKDDVDGSWKEDVATTLPYKSFGAGRLAYNKDDGDGTFSQVEVTDGKWVSMTLIATNDWQYPIKAIQGQNEYTDKKTAVEEATNELISFGGGTLSPEVLVLYRFVLNTKDAFGGTKKTKIEVAGVTDFRTSTVIGGAAIASDHGALAGLADDDHAQYLLVADLENPPTEDESSTAPTSEWAFDHDVATTGVHGAGTDHLALFPVASTVVSKFTPISVDYMFRRDAGEDSSFVADINGNPTATSVVYDGDSRELSLPQIPARDQFGKVVLHNITRGNSRKITGVQTGTNTITTESSSDDWANNDVITTGSQTCVYVPGGHTYSQFFDVDISAEVPSTATGILLTLNCRDLSGASDGTLQNSFALHPYSAYDVGESRVQRALAAHQDAVTTHVVVVNSQKICMALGFYGACTGSGMVAIARVLGYWE